MLNTGKVDKAPGIQEWPGDFSVPPPLKTVTMEIESHYFDWYPTGYYLPAGQQATLQVTIIIYFRVHNSDPTNSYYYMHLAVRRSICPKPINWEI